MEEEEVTAAKTAATKKDQEAAKAAAAAQAAEVAHLTELGTLGVKLTWAETGLSTEEALAELKKQGAAAALSVDLKVKRGSAADRLTVETAVACLHAEIQKGEGLSEIDMLRIVRAVKKRTRRRIQALAKVAG